MSSSNHQLCCLFMSLIRDNMSSQHRMLLRCLGMYDAHLMKLLSCNNLVTTG